jgi:methyltransferase (TIGR00027 family)
MGYLNMTSTVTRDRYGLGGVGETARWMAAARARESRRPDRLFDDPFAEALAGPDGPGLLTHFHPSHANDDGNPYLAIRTRWFDDFLRDLVVEGSQVVGLGAGLDTRAFRLDWPSGVTLYEVDQPAVLAYKDDRLAPSGASPRCERHTIPVNLADDWESALLAAGFEPSRPTVWFAEGVFFYLPEEMARRVLRNTAKLSAPGSRIGLDLIGTGIFRLRYMRQFLSRLAEADSPWRWGSDDIPAFMSSAGWADVKVTEPGHPGSAYGRWPEESSPTTIPNLPRIYLVNGSPAE